MAKFSMKVVTSTLVYFVSTTFGATIYEAPSLAVEDAVQFFYLESSFPYNAPPSIKTTAGSTFTNYGITHAGLGVWDTTTDEKFSIEFISTSYTGALLPDFNNGQIVWQNAGQLVVTSPLVESNWLNSRLIATTTSSSWTQMVTYLQDNLNFYSTYQPVTVMFANSSLLSNSSVILTDDIDSVGGVLVTPTNSFAFVDDMINQLSSYGVNLGAFLQIYATSYDYLSKENAKPTVVSWTGTIANPEVYQWYQNLVTCYTAVYTDTQNNNGGASYFQSHIKECYGNVAYVYKTDNSVYNVTLAPPVPVTGYATPELSQYVYNLPPDDDGDLEGLSILDYFMICIFFISIVGGIAFAIRKFFGKKERRHVSFEGERIAARTVNNLVGGGEGGGYEEDPEEKTYYHGKKRTHTLFSSWGAKSAPPSGKSVIARQQYTEEDLRNSNSLERPLTSAECRLNENTNPMTSELGQQQQTTPSIATVTNNDDSV